MFNRRVKKRRPLGLDSYRSPKVFNIREKKQKRNVTLPKFDLYASFRTLILVAIGGYLLFILLFSGKFKVSEVMVEGTKLIDKQKIEDAAPLGNNIFFFSTNGLKNNLQIDFPEIDNIEVYRGIPNALKIVVLEKEPIILWQSNDKKFLVSSTGDIIREVAGDEGAGLPLVVDKKGLAVAPRDQIVSPNFIAFIKNINSSLQSEVNIKPVSYEVNETTFDVNLITDQGFYVKLNSLRSSKKQLENLKRVLVEKRSDVHEYIDLRIDGWAYYK